MKELKRVLSLVLCFVMLVSIIPTFTFQANAAEKTTYVLAGGDFQQAGDHAGSAENVRNILTQISKKYQTMDGMLFVGDYDCETHESDDNGQTAAGITALMGAVQNSYSNINDANSILVQGNHDVKDSRIDATGGHDFDGYSVFVLNENDYPDGGGTQAGVEALAKQLETWLHNKLGEGYDAPIFITSHLPLAFSPRTNVVGDGKYAKLLFDVINTHAEEGLNIIFMHGHNHAYGNDNYLGGEAIYLAKGSNINIAELGSTTKWTEETLNFTYMNPGYVGYYNEWNYVTTEGTDQLTMTVFAITGSDVTVERYSANGLYNLKSAGRNGRYVRGSEATAVSLGLDKYYTDAVPSPQTISLNVVEDYGDIGSWVGVPPTVVDDVTPSGNGWVTITEPAVAGTRYVYELDTDGVDTGVEYLIVANSYPQALSAAASKNNAVTINLSADEKTAYADSDSYGWTFTRYSNGVYYIRLNGSTYLRVNNGSLASSNNTGSSRRWTVTNNNDGSYDIAYSSYYLRWNNSNGVFQSSNSNQDPVRIYKYVKTETTTGQAGLYGKLDGKLTYEVAAGTSAENALAAVKAGLSVYEAQGMSAEAAGEGTKIEGAEVTLEWIDAYSATTAGDYAVKVSYNGKDLGTAEVVVPATTTYYVAEGNGLYLVDMNTTEANAMAAVKAGVTVYSATDVNGTGKTAISDNDVTWNWVDKYNGADSGPYTVEILKDGHSLGTVEVKVDIKYETGIETDWTYIGETAGSGGTHTYTLDTNGIDYGEAHKYIIVDDDQAIVLNANSSSDGTAHSITISGNTATTTTRDYEYHVLDGFTHNGTAYHKITKGDGSQYLYQESNGVRYGTRSSVKFQVNHHRNGLYDIHDIDGDQWYVYYSGSKWTVEKNTSHRVRLYKYTGTTGGTAGGPVYALIEGNTVYHVEQGTSTAAALAAVKAGITGYTASDANGTGKTEIDDAKLTFKWKNTYASMVTGSYWVEISYQGKVLGTVEVKVEPGVVNNYPEYPNEGSVKVSKTGTGIDFQSSGIAQVEISASGVPMKKGIDVVVMVDTSSSMETWCICGKQNCTSTGPTHQRRNVIFEASLANLINQLKADGADGEPLDIRVALADFNGFNGYNSSASYGSPYDREENDTTNDDNWYSAANQARVFTGDKTLTAGAFVAASELSSDISTYGFNYVSGTNYDYAFDAIYQLGHNIKKANAEAGQDRDLFVVFMSDGAPMQYNYYHSQGNSTRWKYWLTGTVADNGGFSDVVRNQSHIHYYDEIDHDGDGHLNEHRMANAVKGTGSFEIIRKATTGLEDVLTATGEEDMYMLPGLGAKMFSIAFDPADDNNTPASAMTHVLEDIASEQTESTKYYWLADSAADLNNAFTSIGNAIAYAAYNARFVDQMGENYNLQMKTSTYSVVDGDSTSNKTLAPKIEILTYDIYTKADADANQIPAGKHIGDRKLDANGKPIATVLETVTFSADGKEAYSDQIGGGTINILADGTKTGYVKGVIYAKTFLYNTNATDVAVEGVSIPTGTKADGTTSGSTNMLPSETFYWKLGTVQTSELAMRYYVYLDGSMEGHREAGSYPTNNYATLYYDNYLHNPCKKDTVSPVLPWKEANVSYAFYLVNNKGEIIVNQTTGETGSFANKIAITNPVVFDSVLLNDEGAYLDVVTASQVLPDYYEPFDEAASYKVVANSNGSGNWTITGGKVIDGNTVLTTYVTGYDVYNSAAYTYEKEIDDTVHDYTHTTVWFAVELVTQAHPDTVVIDYGLPVEISVLANDMFGENGKLAGVGAITDSLNLDGHDTNLADGFNGYESDFGTATANPNTGKVTYTPSSMQMNTYDEFAYAVNYTGDVNAGYYYDTVTVIPATTIYYEDSFLTYTASNTEWMVEGTAVEGATQGEDRPGKYSITDANNIYGYDGVNKSMSTFSLGAAKKVHVDSDSYATAAFTFYGTGFDIISMTSNTTGVLAVKVTAAEAIKNENGVIIYNAGDKVKATMINTYYGCSYEQLKDAEGNPMVDEDGKAVMGWVSKPNVDQAMYQVPIMQIEELPYGKYDVLMTATYNSALDEDDEDGYWLYLDAVRIYDPANDGAADDAQDTTIEDAYKQDGEGWPSYIELRNKLLGENSFDDVPTNMQMNGLVFIDGMPNVSDGGDITTDQDGNFVGRIIDYKSFGPNNEVYLKSGQSVAFQLTDAKIPVYDKDGKPVLDDNGEQKTESIVAGIHIGVKSADGKTGNYTIKNVASKKISNSIDVGTPYGEKSFTVDTTTDMYYDLSAWKNDIIVISNTGAATDGIISITNIKATYNADPNGTLLTGEDDDTNKAKSVDPINNEVDVFMTYESANLTLRAINGVADQKPDAPQPEDPKPEDPKPEEPKPEEPEAFDPEVTVTVNKDSVKVNQSVQVKVYTDSDVASVVVNGKVITKYSVEKKTGRRVWSTNITAMEAGELKIEVVASNAEGVNAEPVVKTVTVTEKNNGNGNNDNAGSKPNGNNKPVVGIPGSNAMSNFLNNIMNLFKNFWRR